MKKVLSLLLVLCLLAGCLPLAAAAAPEETRAGALPDVSTLAPEAALETILASAPKADAATCWTAYSQGLSNKNAGKYADAIEQFASAVVWFRSGTSADDLINVVNGFREIAVCYGAMGDYPMSAAAYSAAAAACDVVIQAYPAYAHMEQDKISYQRSANALATRTELYLKTDDPAYGSGKYFGVAGEPKNGLAVGAYAEADPNVHNSTSKLYWNEYPTAVAPTGVYLLYMRYGMPLSTYQSHILAAKSKGFAIELSLQPSQGLSVVNETDGYLETLAKDMEASGIQFYLRFAGEMNDSSGGNTWYTPDTAAYIRAFRMVANAMHKWAPSVAVVWAPNSFPANTINDYYPGDAYVDFVGMSMYMTYGPDLDPLGQGVERRRWSDEMDYLYSQYGDRKPIMIVEGAVCLSLTNGTDLSDYAVKQIQDLFTYLPIRYPNVKLFVWFDCRDEVGSVVFDLLTENQKALAAYRQAVSSPSVLSSIDQSSPVYYGKLIGGTVVPEKATLVSYAFAANPVASVRYSVGNTVLGSSSAAPYEVQADLSAWAGKQAQVTVTSYYADGTVAGRETFTLIVEGTAAPVEEPTGRFGDVSDPNAFYYDPVYWAVSKEITNGTGDNLFSPERPCTRGMIVTFLWRAAGKPEPKSTVNPFVDVNLSDYYGKAVLWAVENQITNGMDASHFAPGESCTRGQAVTFLYRAAGKPAAGGSAAFVDLTQDWYRDAVAWAAQAGVTKGVDDTHFAPDTPCTRAHIVTFLYRAQ